MKCLLPAAIAALLSVCLFTSLANLPVAIAATGAPQPAPGDAQLWSIAFTEPAHLGRLASALDVWEVDHEAGQALVLLSEAQAADLADRGEILLFAARKPQGVRNASGAVDGVANHIPGFPCYRNLEQIERDMRALADAHQDLATWSDIGDSWDKLRPAEPEGHDIHALIITNRASTASKSKLMVVAALHARELVTAEIAARFGEYLVARYGVDPDVTWLLDHGEIHIIPVANPDGRRFAEQLYYWRKNTNSADGCPVYAPNGYSYGVDLNRNFGLQWNACTAGSCSSGDPCSPIYRGSAPESEPETRVLQSYTGSLFPDQRISGIESSAPFTTSGILLSLHSYGELVMFPWGWTDAPSPDEPGLRAAGARLAEPLGYRTCQTGEAGCLYQVDGGLEDWAHGRLGIGAYTLEFGTEFFQSCSYFQDRMLAPALDSLTLAAKYSRRPYAMAAAPQVDRVDLSQPLVTRGTPLTLVVSLDSRLAHTDTTVGFQFVLDNPSWVANDDEVVQVLAAALPAQGPTLITHTVDTSLWSVGRHMLFVEGLGDNGVAGVPVATYVDIVASHMSYMPTVTERNPLRPKAFP